MDFPETQCRRIPRRRRAASSEFRRRRNRSRKRGGRPCDGFLLRSLPRDRLRNRRPPSPEAEEGATVNSSAPRDTEGWDSCKGKAMVSGGAATDADDLILRPESVPPSRPTSASESGAVRSVAETAEDAGGLAQSA